ncbi:Uncharacterised protein [Vibrio cholerae]|nr:Uncharacterised protein [Vibrio cholerae]
MEYSTDCLFSKVPFIRRKRFKIDLPTYNLLSFLTPCCFLTQ